MNLTQFRAKDNGKGVIRTVCFSGALLVCASVAAVLAAKGNRATLAENMGEVISLNRHVEVVYGDFDDCLKMRNYTPLDPKANEFKYYALAWAKYSQRRRRARRTRGYCRRVAAHQFHL